MSRQKQGRAGLQKSAEPVQAASPEGKAPPECGEKKSFAGASCAEGGAGRLPPKTEENRAGSGGETPEGAAGFRPDAEVTVSPVPGVPGVPDYLMATFLPRQAKYCLLIPIINEGARILAELDRAKAAGVPRQVDVILCDGGSTDGSMDPAGLVARGVNTLLVKTGPGKQGAQLRMGLHFALRRGYEGVLTIDGNNKDSIESVPLFTQKLGEGYDLIQGSRFIRGGQAVNTPFSRWLAVQLIHAPAISLAARQRFTDTTNAYRAYSRAYLTDARVQPLRDIFAGYELLAYLSVRATQLGYRACEVPVRREYPKGEKTPTKIRGFKGNSDLLRCLWGALTGKYNP